MRFINDSVTSMLERAADACTMRHRAIANNIANVNTPGYKAKDVVFEEKLKRYLGLEGSSGGRTGGRIELARTNRGHIGSSRSGLGGAGLEPEMVVNEDTRIRPDGNNVDIDLEMAKLAENEIRYNSILSVIDRRFRILEYVISEGKR